MASTSPSPYSPLLEIYLDRHSSIEFNLSIPPFFFLSFFPTSTYERSEKYTQPTQRRPDHTQGEEAFQLTSLIDCEG